ncbi:MAG: hypothetical protein ACKV19_09700 [Verrucomicrobiales bacterium]
MNPPLVFKFPTNPPRPIFFTFVLLAAPGLWAQSGIGYTRVAGSGDQMPVSGSVFLDLNWAAVDGGMVAFLGDGEGPSEHGIYTWLDGVLTRVADTRSPMLPPDDETLGNFNRPSLAGGEVSFLAGGLNHFGIYSNGTGLVQKVVEAGDPLPGGAGQVFESFHPEISRSPAGSTAWQGNSTTTPPWRIYRNAIDAIETVVSEMTPIPEGVGNFTNAGLPSAGTTSSTIIAARGFGNGGQDGIYTFLRSGLNVRVADRTTSIPAGTGAFTSFENPVQDGERTAFQGFGAGGQFGIYLKDGTTLTRVVDRTTPVPSSSGLFRSSLGTGYLVGSAPADKRIALDDGNLAFFGGPSTSTRGIYLYTGATGTLALLHRESGTIDGRAHPILVFTHDGLSGRRIVFRVEFEDDESNALYTAECASYAVAENGAWDAAANWTFNAVPGAESATLISTGASVLGPAASAPVRGLEVIAFDDDDPSTLVLQSGGAITASNGAQISANGVLAGSGSLTVGAGRRVRVVGKAAQERAVIAPGGGALGNIALGGDVGFADFSEAQLNLNATGGHDALAIDGDLDFSPTSSRLVLSVLGGTSGGDYPLLTYTGARSGTFASVIGLPAGYTLDYGTPGRIILRGSFDPDTDDDGIPDAWELTYAPNLGTLSASGDFDHDGANDLDEYAADTDPLDPAQRHRITDIGLDPETGEVYLVWTSRAVCRYRVESADSPGGPWLDESGTLDPSDGPTTTFFVPFDPSASRFFRIVAFRPD